MNRIIKIGMDVHSTNYTLCAVEPTIGAEDMSIVQITLYAQWNPQSEQRTGFSGKFRFLRITKRSFPSSNP